MLAREIKEGDSIIVDVVPDGKVIVFNSNRDPPSCPPFRAPKDKLPVPLKRRSP